MGPKSKDRRRKKNKIKRSELSSKKREFYRRKQEIAIDEDEVSIAGYFRRTGQYLIDFFTISFFSIAFLAAAEVILDMNEFPPIIYVLPQIAIGLAYIVPSYVIRGQTFGFKILSIVVIKADGSGYLSISSAIIRWFSLYLMPNLYVFLISQGQPIGEQIAISIFGLVMIFIIILPVFITKKRQGLHDRLSGSIVVRDWAN